MEKEGSTAMHSSIHTKENLGEKIGLNVHHWLSGRTNINTGQMRPNLIFTQLFSLNNTCKILITERVVERERERLPGSATSI